MWIVCQIGAREHYAIARALERKGELAAMVTDFWVSKRHWMGILPGSKRLRDRVHADLVLAVVRAPNLTMLSFELQQRLKKRRGWALNMKRNSLFQRKAISVVSKIAKQGSATTLFSYSYAARDLFSYAKQRELRCALGQIDPGPEEERIVAAEHLRYPQLGSKWEPAPASYWESWHVEVELADVIIVNSEWSRQCLLKEGIPDQKLRVIPLVYKYVAPVPAPGLGEDPISKQPKLGESEGREDKIFKVLFLGQVNLRKGIGRLLEAAKFLEEEKIQITLAGPSEVDSSSWADLPNVEWLGSIPRSQVGELYEKSDVFILPTLSDGYAITQLEALSRGLPVIASANCGAAVRHGVNGWILDDLEPETIAKAILDARNENLKPVSPNVSFNMEDLGDALSDLA